MHRTKVLLALGALLLGLTLPGLAVAQTPTNDAYDDNSVTVVCGNTTSGDPGDPGDPADPGDPGNSAGGDPGDRVVTLPADDPRCDPGEAENLASGALPFSGLDLAVIVATGLALATLGFAMRRATRRAEAG